MSDLDLVSSRPLGEAQNHNLSHVLVLGASSKIGAALAQAFAPNSRLVLVGRDPERLAQAAEMCRNAGALHVDFVSVDLSSDMVPLIQTLATTYIHLIIDAASSSSAKRDNEIGPDDIGALVAGDFLSRLKLLDYMKRVQGPVPAVIFISTVLTLVRSPGREVYSSLKRLDEIYFTKLRDTGAVSHLLIVHVGKVIDKNNGACEAEKLATVVSSAFRLKRTEMLYGLSGRLFVILFYFQPLLFAGVALAQRSLRTLLGRR